MINQQLHPTTVLPERDSLFAHVLSADFAVALYLEVLQKTGSVAEAAEAARIAGIARRQLEQPDYAIALP